MSRLLSCSLCSSCPRNGPFALRLRSNRRTKTLYALGFARAVPWELHAEQAGLRNRYLISRTAPQRNRKSMRSSLCQRYKSCRRPARRQWLL